MGKNRDLFKKIRYTKKTFHAIKDRNDMDQNCLTIHMEMQGTQKPKQY